MATAAKGSKAEKVNKMNPAAQKAKLGDTVADLVTNFNALLAKLDANHAAAVDHSTTLGVQTFDQRN